MRAVFRAPAVLSMLVAGTAWSQASPSPFTTGYRFDAARHLVGTISSTAGGGYEAVRNTFDAEGRIVKVERGYLAQWQSEATPPASWSGFTVKEITDRGYDTYSRRLTTEKLASSTGADPTLTQYSYDIVGRRECTAIRMNAAAFGSLPSSACALGTQGSYGPDRITRLVYDAAGQVTQEQRAVGTSLQQNYASYGYTPNGRQDWVEDANGNRTDYSYDGFDRLAQFNFPQTTIGTHVANTGDYEHYGYDANDNRISLRLRSGETITYEYDALNRVTRKVLPAPSSDVRYGYDLQGHTLFARFGSASGTGVTNEFDGLGRQTLTSTSVSGSTLQLTFESDADGNRTRVIWPDSTYVQYTYDGMNRMAQVRENGATSPPGLLAYYSYDSLGRRSNLIRGNGTMTSYYYDGISRLSEVRQDLSSTGGDVNFGLTYNHSSQILQRTVSNEAYAYFSMPMSKSYTPDGLNRYGAVGGVSYGYDGRGNLTSDGSRTFGYDFENHLVSVSGTSSMNLVYDPLGRLASTTSGGKTIRFLYEGDRLVGEYDGTTLLRRYVHGAGVDEPLAWYEGATLTDRRWFHTDQQGSVVSTSDSAGRGTLYAYGAYGEPAYDNWAGSRFRYTGQILLPEARLYHYKARVYDPVLGRFLQMDPVSYADNLNIYGYTGNDPVNSVDPSGQACVIANGWSAYCMRGYMYAAVDARLSGSTRFFGAASATTTMLANLDMPIFKNVVTASTRSFMGKLSSDLQSLNERTAIAIEKGTLTSANLNAALVHKEQTAVQEHLDALRGADLSKYNQLVTEVNKLLNPTGAAALAANVYPSDKAYQDVLESVRKSLGRDIDFSSQSDREAIGNALIDKLESEQSCTKTGSRIATC